MQALLKLMEDDAFGEGKGWRRRPFKSGELIVREGEPASSLYLVERGSLEVSATVELQPGQAAEPAICELKSGDVFGELSLFSDQPRAANVKATSVGMLIEFDSQALARYFDANPAAGYAVLKLLYRTLIERLGATNRRLADMLVWGLSARGLMRH